MPTAKPDDKRLKQNKDLDVREQQRLSKIFGALDEKGKAAHKHALSLSQTLESLDIKQLDDALKKMKKIVKTEKDRYHYLKLIQRKLKEAGNTNAATLKALEKEIELTAELAVAEEDRLKLQGNINKYLKMGNKHLMNALATNKEIYEISHKMQLDSNITWENYSKLYDAAYKSTREMNKEVNQNVHNVKDLIATQEKLLSDGWKDIPMDDVNGVSTAVMQLSKTLGSFPAELSTAFQQSYRIFGEKTERFVTAMGNRLNAFSNTFGISIGMLSGAVTDMMASNNFISRSNMNAQMNANESLMRAAALTANIGLTSTNFLTALAKTSQFGTMEEMANLYQGGAMIQNFDTGEFQQKMTSQDYAGATMDLFKGIKDTFDNIDDHYVRAEYMQRIGGSFGLSDDDIMNIVTNGGNLEAYDDKLQNKLIDINTSMKDEIAGLNVAIVDQFTNWRDSWKATQTVGKFFQDIGLYGIEGLTKTMVAELGVLILQSSMQNGLLGKGFSGLLKFFGKGAAGGAGQLAGQTSLFGPAAGGGISGLTGAFGTTGAAALGIAGAGALAGGGLALWQSNRMKKNMMDTNLSNKQANNRANWNMAGMAGGGALAGAAIGSIVPIVGTAIGAGIGAVVGGAIGLGTGLVQKSKLKKERASMMESLDNERRASARAASGASFLTGDPMVDAINQQTEILAGVLDSQYSRNREMFLMGNTINETKAKLVFD